MDLKGLCPIWKNRGPKNPKLWFSLGNVPSPLLLSKPNIFLGIFLLFSWICGGGRPQPLLNPFKQRGSHWAFLVGGWAFLLGHSVCAILRAGSSLSEVIVVSCELKLGWDKPWQRLAETRRTTRSSEEKQGRESSGLRLLVRRSQSTTATRRN